ncbi:MAG: calcium/sodium antiporter [Nitrospirota bacterium]|nr:MAG: calcium/sodium antiporter [Nitrospirota bacterium]
MTILLYLALSLIGFVLLFLGAEWLVRGSSSLARSLGIRPIIIGLTVVAFGTSAPELVVSIISSIKGNSMIAVGNIVGSNICNIALILGLAASFRPLTTHYTVISRDIPIMLVISAFLLAISMDSMLGRMEGMVMLIGIFLYTLYNYNNARRESLYRQFTSEAHIEKVEGHVRTRGKQYTFIIVGLIGVVVGAEIVVDSAVVIMTMLGASEKFIGLTIVAFGTSLPELATSVVAAIRKELDISVGNLVGSNVFNILSVLGTASLIRPIKITGGFVDSGLYIDYLVMIFISALPWVFMRKTRTISRFEGAILLSSYIGYISFLVIKH